MKSQGAAYHLSSAVPRIDRGVILLMVGSYAPVHEGHVAAMTAAVAAVEASGQQVASVVYVPNGDSYVSFKIRDSHGMWNFNRRIEVLMRLVPRLAIPTFVDDISGSIPIVNKSITRTAITSAAEQLGVSPSRFVIVVGSDQAASVEPYLATNQAVCVVRPGAVAPLAQLAERRMVSSGGGHRSLPVYGARQSLRRYQFDSDSCCCPGYRKQGELIADDHSHYA